MIPRLPSLFLISALAFSVPSGWAAGVFEHEAYCAHGTALAAFQEGAIPRQYPPDREVDVLHLALDVTPDFAKRSVAGSATVTFAPIGHPLMELSLDAVDLEVSEVTSTAELEAYQVTGDKILITFAEAIPAGVEARVTVVYEAEPRKGLYFRTPEMGYPEEETHLFTQGEPMEARHWYPSHDFPNEKFSSEITCRVPGGMVVFSNGRKVSEEADAETGRISVRWLQEKPHVNYLISLVAGHFETIEDRYGDIPLAFHTPPSDIGEAPNSFEGTKEMMAFFEEEIGVPYPWAKYDQVVIRDFMWGGMENTSLTTLTDRTLFTKETENIRSSQSLVAHELAHQWFGDLVTCRDWSHIWLNEGFATYYDVLYDGHRNGRDQLLYRMYQTGQSLIGRSGTPRPIVSRVFGEAVDQFRSHGYLAYGKGSWILHMLRSQLGESLYRECIRTFLERHEFDTVTTADLMSVLEEVSGRSFDRFFDQWVFHAHHPELKVSYAWDQQAGLARVSVVQEQDVSDSVLLFHFPLTIRFLVRDRTEDREVTVRSRTEDFYFPFTEAPKLVRIDPELALLARIDFDVPAPMLGVQLKRESDVIGRLLAVEQHGRRKGARDVEALRETLNSDSFHGVRMAASEALRRIHSDEALEALRASLDQSDARVRNQVVRDLGGFFHPDALETVLEVAATEENPIIRGEAVQGAGRYAASEVREQLVGLLGSESHRNHLVGDAIAAMRRQDDPVYVEPLMGMLGQRGGELTSRGFAEGLEALAFLARHEEEKAEVREFISEFLNEKREPVQLAAIRSLGMLGDPRAAAALEAFAGAGRESRQREVAADALRELRAGERPAVALGELRSEVLELKRINETLRRSLDELEKKVEAKWSEKAEGAPDKPAVKPLHSPRGAQQAR